MKPILDQVSNEDLGNEVKARLARPTSALSWVTAYREGDAIRSDAAAVIEGCSTDTIRRRCIEADDVGEPIGILLAGVWLISIQCLLDGIERRKGHQARAAAEERATKLLKSRAVAIGHFAAMRARDSAVK